MSDTSTYHIDTLRSWIESFKYAGSSTLAIQLAYEGNTAIVKQILDDAVLEFDLTTENQLTHCHYEAIINAVASPYHICFGRDTVVASVEGLSRKRAVLRRLGLKAF